MFLGSYISLSLYVTGLKRGNFRGVVKMQKFYRVRANVVVGRITNQAVDLDQVVQCDLVLSRYTPQTEQEEQAVIDTERKILQEAVAARWGDTPYWYNSLSVVGLEQKE
jgi:hypothetical protein